MSEKEILSLNDKCKLEFTKDGNIKLIGDCNGAVMNPVEIQLLDRVNQDNDAK